MRLRILLPLAVTAALALPAGARADFAHVVTRGESLASIAAVDGLSVSALAAANRLAPDARLVVGSVVQIPPRRAGTRAGGPPASRRSAVTRRASDGDGDHDRDRSPTVKRSVPAIAAPGLAASRHYIVQRGDTLSGIAARSRLSLLALAAMNGIHPSALLLAGSTLTVPGSAHVGLAGSRHYIVQRGDTLSGIAARSGLSLLALAAMNGIHPSALLLAGSTLTVPSSSAAQGSLSVPPYPTPERVTAAQVEQVAVANGVPASLAAAIGWQESGFNNDLVSSADARGVMQILPRTWDWIQRTLTGGTPLAPASAIDNVRGGVLLLHSLLIATQGNPALAAAGYVQGLLSIHENGVFPSTQQYVNSVMALRQSFGGP